VKQATWNDAKVEQIVGRLLQIGVSLAAFVVLVGGVLYVFSNAHMPLNYRSFQSEPAALRSMRSIIGGAAHLDGRGVIQLGLLLLIATPVARVTFSIIAFAMERDRTYVVVTFIVLGILLYSLSGATL
jgi:uncharacterized membrane protein